MPIPLLIGEPHAYWLPPGTHDCSPAEVEERFVYNEQRQKVWRYFMFVMERMRDLGGTLPSVVVDGSFVTGRAQPDDVDAVCQIPPHDLMRMLGSSRDQHALGFFLQQPHAARRLFGVHVFVVETEENLEEMRVTFARGLGGAGLRPADLERDPHGLVVPGEKGILRVDFTAFFGGTDER